MENWRRTIGGERLGGGMFRAKGLEVNCVGGRFEGKRYLKVGGCTLGGARLEVL